ncbi:MAG TPA: ectonucleotide pyrophosphatase/phosphodiesterase [Bryobacteraceae bacterium]|nr:ectonucleotide pyrophosphatase/phosphodiesterase [Bryobacteraceae bacterium]
MRVRALQFFCFAALAAAQPAPDRHVIVMSIDGFPAYALRDPGIPLPVLRKLIAEGGAAEGVTPINPTVTWPNHTAIVTGVDATKHGVLYNGLPVRGADGRQLRVQPWVDKTQLVEARTVYDAAHDAGLTVAEVDWVAIYHAASVNWSFAELPQEDGVAREMIDRGLVTQEQIRNFQKFQITLKDDIWMRAAVHIIETHKPNLLLLHLLATDSAQHQYGARSLAANTALILGDRQVQRVLDAIDRAGIRESTTLFVVSDHGFKSFQHTIRPNALLREKGLLAEREGQVDCDAWAVTEGGTAMVYVTREGKRATLLPALAEAFRGVPGVAQIILPAEYPKFGYPSVTPGGRMADMVLAAAPGYAFEPAITGQVAGDVPAGASLGTHGYLASDPDMTAILVAWGAGIRPGSHAGVVPNLSIAPTIARLLGVPLPGTPAPPLGELLQ